MGNGTYSNLVVRSTDEDWYRIVVEDGYDLSIELDFVNANGDIDANLYDACGGSIIATGDSNNNDESISWTNNTGGNTTVYLNVFMYSDTENNYNMTVDGGEGGGCPAGFTPDCQGTCFPDGVYTDWQGDTFCDDGSYIPADYCDYPSYDCNECPPGVAIYLNCDQFDCDGGDCTGCDGGGGGGGGGGGDCDGATVIGLGDTPFDTTGSSTSVDLTGYCDPGTFGDDLIYNSVFFEFTPDESGTITVSTCNQATFDTRLSVHAGDCDPSSVITCLDDTDGCDGFTTELSYDATGGNTYFIVVGGYSAGDAGTGTLTLSTDGGGGGGGGGGGDDCPDGWAADCQGTCFPQYVFDAWLGDTFCDDGSYIPADYGCDECPPGVAMFLNCDEYGCDNGDCTDCDGGGGGGGGGECDPTTVVVGDNSVDTTDAVGVTLDLTGYCDPGEFGTDAFLNTAFYAFTAPASGPYVVTTCNQAAWDTRLSVHTDDCSPENVIVCLDDTDGCENYTTTIEFSASAGQLYVIALGGYGAADYGVATLTIEGDNGGGSQEGACCLGFECSLQTGPACADLGGTFLGNGTSCSDSSCSGQTGACCLNNGCSTLSEADCADAGGEFIGGACGEDTCGSTCLGDLNGDSIVDGSDLTILLGDWDGPGGDVNGDGTTDGSDLTVLLGYWGDC